jgi:hypothetical protein
VVAVLLGVRELQFSEDRFDFDFQGRLKQTVMCYEKTKLLEQIKRFVFN